MALANYTDLVTSVQNWLHRDDLASIMPDFISLAEARISKDLKIQALEKQSTITTVAGQQDYTFPSDLVALVRMFVTDAAGNISPLQGFYPNNYSSTVTDKPSHFNVEADTLKLNPIPDGAYTVTVIYKGSVPSLQTNTTNTVMTKYPNIYLFCTSIEACLYIKDKESAAAWEMRYQQAIKDANLAEDFKEHNLLKTNIMVL